MGRLMVLVFGLCAALVLVAGCTSSEDPDDGRFETDDNPTSDGDADGDGDTDADSDADTDTPTDTATDFETDSGLDTGSDSGADTGTAIDTDTGTGSGLDAEAQGWLNAHNAIRQRANDGTIPGQPQAVPPMDDLTWDPLLAQVAQAYAETCVWAHNSNRRTQYEALGGSGSVGENLWMTSSTSWSFNPTSVIDSWYSEYSLYTTWEPIDGTNYQDIGHYTQLVWRNTSRVGCGYAVCPFGTVVACDYNPAGNFIGQYPY